MPSPKDKQLPPTCGGTGVSMTTSDAPAMRSIMTYGHKAIGRFGHERLRTDDWRFFQTSLLRRFPR